MNLSDLELWLRPVPELHRQYRDLLISFGEMVQQRAIVSAAMELAIVPEAMVPYAVVELHACTSSSCGLPPILVHPTARRVLPKGARRNLIGMKDMGAPEDAEIEYPDVSVNPEAAEDLANVVAGLSFEKPIMLYMRKLQQFMTTNHCFGFKVGIAMRRIEDENTPDVHFHVCSSENCFMVRFAERPRRSISNIFAQGATCCRNGSVRMPRNHLLQGEGVIVMEKKKL